MTTYYTVCEKWRSFIVSRISYESEHTFPRPQTETCDIRRILATSWHSTFS